MWVRVRRVCVEESGFEKGSALCLESGEQV
jgi:hypothetical protein